MARSQQRAGFGVAKGLLVVMVVAFTAGGAFSQSADAESAAVKEVQGLKVALQEAEARISGLQASYEQEKAKAEAAQVSLDALNQQSESAGSALREAQGQAAAAVAEAAQLREGKAAAEVAAETAQKAQRLAEAARDELQARLDKAEGLAPQLSQAQAELAGAQASLAKAEAELTAAKARADDTQALADSLLAQHYNEWVPHWVADGYERRVRPAAAAAWETTSETSRSLYKTGSVKAGQLWETASPTVNSYTEYTKTLAADAHAKVVKHPHIAAAKAKLGELRASFFGLKPVKALAAQAAKVQAELEAVFGKFLRAHPLLAPLGEPGTVKHVVWGVLAAPLLALLLPAVLFPRRKQPKAAPASSSSGRAAAKAKKVKK